MEKTFLLIALAACNAEAATPDIPATLAGTLEARQTFTPQYPLWSDGAKKQRWIYLPAPIDGRDADNWVFPVGTKLWKQFAFDGQVVETRYMERTGEGWRFATYLADGTRAPIAGVRGEHPIPSEADCRACHDQAAPVLGFGALQLSSDRDPNAPHAEAAGELDLDVLIASKRLRNYTGPAQPRIAGDETARAALGYLHGNCGGCHNARLAGVGMVLRSSVDHDVVRPTTFGIISHYAPRARIAPGDANASVIVERMSSRSPVAQMPPLATRLVDRDAVQLISNWINQEKTP